MCAKNNRKVWSKRSVQAAVCGVLVTASVNVFALEFQLNPELLGEVSSPTEEKGIVKLVATLQDNPAFTTDVVWKLYRTDIQGAPVITIPRHTAIVPLKPGNYRAEALLNSVVRSRSFNLESKGVKEIVLPMDEVAG